jgi:hypothetical protein
MAATTETATPLLSRRVSGRGALVTVRAIAAVHVVAIFAQPVFAGRYLVGDYDMLAVHALGADLVFFLGLVQLTAALVLWWRGGVRWPAGVSLLLALGETGQYFAGLAGALDLHFPLGVALVTLATIMLVALSRPQSLRGAQVAR